MRLFNMEFCLDQGYRNLQFMQDFENPTKNERLIIKTVYKRVNKIANSLMLSDVSTSPAFAQC